MFKPLTLFIGLRYTRAKRRNHFISFISLISILGIALGVTALITVMSVMSGFEKELRDRILSMASHANITSNSGGLKNWQQLATQITHHPEVISSAPYVHGEVMMSHRKGVKGGIIRGIDPDIEPEVSDFMNQLKQAGTLNKLQAGQYGIILGHELAYSLGVIVGDKVTLISPQTSVSITGILPRIKRFTVVGTFELGMYQYDSGLALVHIKDAAKFFKLKNAVSGLRLKLTDMFLAPEVSDRLERELGVFYRVRDWTMEHRNYFRAVKMEKRVMFIILVLIIAVAAFNIISTLVMVVTDKEREIAILRSIGMSPSAIMRVFMVQGTMIGLLGTILGVSGGVGLALNVETIVPIIESAFSMKFLQCDIYYICDLPSDLRWPDVIKIGSVSFLLSIGATLYPAWRASKIQPAEALRYE